MKDITHISFEGKRVLVRVDFNVPLESDFTIADDSRIIAALPTINKILSGGGRLVLMSHLGRPKNGFEEQFSIKHLVPYLSSVIKRDVQFCSDCVGKHALTTVNAMQTGSVVLLENLRFYPEEKKGDIAFAAQLAQLADIYVNDAFGTAHRAHASTSIIADFFPENKYFGLLLSKELTCLEKSLSQPKRPFTAIIGGAKISGKIDVIKALYEKVDNLIIGGGMAYTFAKAMGGDIGKSLVEQDKVFLAKSLIDLANTKGINLLLPADSVNADAFNNDANTNTTDIKCIPNNYMGLDIGVESIQKFTTAIEQSKTIIWNGPMGVFEFPNFANGTKLVGEAICNATESGAFSLVGGGDSVAALKQFGFDNKVSYLSTGGGAMLEYLEGKQLPGVTAILN